MFQHTRDLYGKLVEDQQKASDDMMEVMEKMAKLNIQEVNTYTACFNHEFMILIDIYLFYEKLLPFMCSETILELIPLTVQYYVQLQER